MRFVLSVMAVLAVASPAFAKKSKKPAPAPKAAVVAIVADPVPTPGNLWHLDLSTGGSVVIALRPDKAPNHVERIKTLTRAGFYDGLLFHRVIEGFMAQTGDPKGTGEGGSPLPDLKAEFNDLPHLRGALSMARPESPDGANSQFFIVFQPVLRLDGKYTVFGRVTGGMTYVDAIARGEPPAEPSKIMHAWIEADGPTAPRVALVVPPVAAPPPAK
jgi:cyclophilin family peptidyl-prolyl cis-trans isomerase